MNLRPMSLRVIARHYVSERMVGARCKSASRLWSRAEAGWRQAKTNADAALAAAPAFALCAECPMSDACAEWAQTERSFIGLAAGLSWNRGKAHRTKFGPAVALPPRRAAALPANPLGWVS